MTWVLKNAGLGLVLTGLLMAQPAMAKRSAESLPAPGAKVMSVGERIGSRAKTAEEVAGNGIPAAFLLGGLITIGAIIIAIQSGNNNNGPTSPG